MKRFAAIFLLVVLVPSIVLAALALRSQQDQEAAVERQRALVHQGTVDVLAREVNNYMASQQAAFRDAVDAYLAEAGDADPASGFDDAIRAAWPLAKVGFVTGASEASPQLVSPEAGRGDDRAERFRELNEAFIEGSVAHFAYAWNVAPPSDSELAPDGRRGRPAEARDLAQNEFNQFRLQQQEVEPPSAFYRIAGRDEAQEEAEERLGQLRQRDISGLAGLGGSGGAADRDGTRGGEHAEALAAAATDSGLRANHAFESPELESASAVAAPADSIEQKPAAAPAPSAARSGSMLLSESFADPAQSAPVAGQESSAAAPPHAVAPDRLLMEALMEDAPQDESEEISAAAVDAEIAAPDETLAVIVPAEQRLGETVAGFDTDAMTRSEPAQAPVAGKSGEDLDRRAVKVESARPQGDADAFGVRQELGFEADDALKIDDEQSVEVLGTAVSESERGTAVTDEKAASEFGAFGESNRDGMHLADQLAETPSLARFDVTAPASPDIRNLSPAFALSDGADAGVPRFSSLRRREIRFPELASASDSGALARFLDSGLSVLLWCRPNARPDLVFGAEIDLDRLKQILAGVVEVEFEAANEAAVALLDDAGAPVAVSPAGFASADWRRPFVSTEIGEILPRWEVAAYLLDPDRLGKLARAERLRFGLLILGVMAAIAAGGMVIMADTRRQIADGRLKTDFVSNVSHELKTPLTSISMFSELLADDAPVNDDKRRRYAEVIRGEAGRLTRLINNVLDFSRLERSERKYTCQPLDVAALVRETSEAYRPTLEKEGFTLSVRTEENLPPIHGDHDALAQVLINLLSNAEKYSGDRREIEVAARVDGGNRPAAAIDVLDRGRGVPRGRDRRIFEKFYRAEDSLSSGVQGSGLGLTLARQIARAHGGDISFRRRDGGGSCFTILLPSAEA